jgi:pimeloyl-ACP methyl ester carboxylesterase
MSLHRKYTDSRRVILYSHGNAIDIGGCHEICEVMSAMLDAHVIAYDYPNYGASSKTCMCESALNSSIEAVYARCMEIAIPQEKLILMGQSLGSVPTLHLASRVYAKYSGVILISPLASAFRAGFDEKYFPSFVSRRLDGLLFNNLKAIEDIHAPVAIVHGFADDVIDISSAELLHSKIPRPFRHSPLYISSGHNDIYDEGNLVDVTAYLQGFIRDASEKQAPAKQAPEPEQAVSSDAPQDPRQPLLS